MMIGYHPGFLLIVTCGFAECSVVEVTDKLEAETEVKEVHCCTSTKISSAQDDIEVASAVTEATKFTTCSSSSQDNEEDKVLGGKSVVTRNHSISVEA